ncbi:hypothetical protein [Oscillatoria sp. FACHB-1406]|uniref:hypothetical protein n=1 Tax=Oscillatoria sp. FACHB-1406 TaxID=2692846 RepID=UPI0016868137|nr:hypothetical protein [Oscillatoria sp. FACHB-1406]MBD2577007.1 hypothetical protein [Oscillatoria sp. FACHB-1406]
MKSFQIGSLFSIAVSAALTVNPAFALPGERTEAVLTWMNANPTLQPTTGNSLTVRREDTPSRRFRFQASALPPGRISVPTTPGRIRSEKFEIVDIVNGVPMQRLEESLRAIYGLDIYNDYALASLLYSYPHADTLEQGRRQNLPSLGAQRGELREGKRFAYWVEVTYAEDGKPLNGQVTLLLKDDLEKLASELRDR